MKLWRVASLSLLLVLVGASVADANYYTYMRVMRQTGHFTGWWTKDGVRTSATPENPQGTPCVDADFVPGDTIWVSANIQWANDLDWKLTLASAQKTDGIVHAYTFPDFRFVVEWFGGALSWFDLIDPGGNDLSQTVTLEAWGEYLKTNPLPDPGMIFMFQDGSCPELPGYQVTLAADGLPLTGPLLVGGVNQLQPHPVGLPALPVAGVVVLALLLAGSALLVLRCRAV